MQYTRFYRSPSSSFGDTARSGRTLPPLYAFT